MPQLPHSSFEWKTNRHPLAIVMWDFSWLLHHYPTGAFEDYDACLDGLVERGYNAIRLDCFPQFIADSDERPAQEVYFHGKPSTLRELWQNPYSIDSRPRESLIEMLTKCRERDIHLGLSSWFLSHGTDRNKEFKGVEGLVRAWHETLTFLANEGLLENVLYVDLLNEYPLWNGYSWFKDEIARIGKEAIKERDEEKANEPVLEVMMGNWSGYNAEQTNFYNDFIATAIRQLKAEWPNLRFFASQTCDYAVPWTKTDHSLFEVMDIHIWLILYREFFRSTDYFPKVHVRAHDRDYRECDRAMREYWQAHRAEVVGWMEKEIKERAQAAHALDVPIGNTEGWGPINWEEHPYLNWEFTKEAAEICIPLARKYGYQFICTSNFTHPQFPSLWADVAWHRHVTDLIKQPL